jgi:site-specific DNA-methyltransferase (adenine-specific)
MRLNRVLVGDASRRVRLLPRHSVDCVVTSPPYFRLRDYQHRDQIGLEREIDDWVANVQETLRAIWDVLTPTGSVWLNVADSYSRGGDGAQTKSLLLGPERLLLAAQADGWIVRNKIIWAKTNPMPSSVNDRLSNTWEAVYLLVKQPRYTFDLDAIRVPHTSTRSSTSTDRPAWTVPPAWRGPATNPNSGLDKLRREGRVGHPLGKNPGDVWQLSTAAYAGNHHAVFPLSLALRPIAATCPQKRCAGCRTPWAQQPARAIGHAAISAILGPSCRCDLEGEPGLTLDPFLGSGTVAIAAERLGRNWLGIELNPEIAEQARERIQREREAIQQDQRSERKEVKDEPQAPRRTAARPRLAHRTDTRATTTATRIRREPQRLQRRTTPRRLDRRRPRPATD